MRQSLTATLFLGAATLAFGAPLGVNAQPMRTAAAEPAVPAAAKALAGAETAAFSPAPTPANVAVATPAPTSAAPAPAAAAPATPAPAATDPNNRDGIAATVGDNSISDFELEQRVTLFFATSGFKPTGDDLKRARKMQLDQLIDEHLQMSEAAKRHITVSPLEVDKRLDEWAKRQNTNVKDLTEALAKAGSSIEVVRQQQIASIAWGKTVYSEFGDNVVVTPAMVDDTMRRDSEGASKTHYRVMEIYLPVDNLGDAAKDAEVKKQIDDINAKVRAGNVLFRNLAQQYSRDPSAAAGGDIGWVYDGQLDPDLNAALATMRNGELSQPVRAKGGWYLLGLQERQEPMGTNVSVPVTTAYSGPPGTLPLARLLLPVPRNIPAEQVQNLLANAERIREATASCEMLEKISQDKQLQGSIFMNPLKFAKLVNPSTNEGFIKLSDVSEQIQKALADSKPGDVAAPFQSDAGIELIARCDPRPPPPRTAFAPRKRDDIQEELFQEQIAAMARRFMRDLKRDANIQERNDSAVMDAALIQ